MRHAVRAACALTGRAVKRTSSESRALIVTWSKLHAVRTALGLAATAGFLVLASTLR